jgi:uncharacterized protein YjiK
MKKQVYFSFVLAILSFITVKRLEKASVDRYHFVQSPVFQKEFGWFNFAEPEFIHSVPFELREISGITSHAEGQMACVQDEEGVIYIYDLYNNTIIDKITFAEPGDFEGLTKVDSTFYVLRSDAQLYSVTRSLDSVIVNSNRLSIHAWDNEALCYDQRNKRLLLTPKSKNGKGPEFKGQRAIFEISLETGKLNPIPIFTIQVEDILKFALDKNIPLPKKEASKITDSIDYFLKFKPSSIAVHPKTNDIYVISAIDHTMAVFEKSGKLINFMTLDPVLFNKTEGMTFLPNGDLIVTNEGQMGTPTLLKFNWQYGSRE